LGFLLFLRVVDYTCAGIAPSV